MKPHSFAGSTPLTPSLQILSSQVRSLWGVFCASPTSFHFPVVGVPLGWGRFEHLAKINEGCQCFSPFFTCLVPVHRGRGHSIPFGFAVCFECGGRAVSVTGPMVTVPDCSLASLFWFVNVGLPGNLCLNNVLYNKRQAMLLSLGYYFYLVVVSFVFCHL